MATRAEENQAFRVATQKLLSGDDRMVKEADNSLNLFIRQTFKEQSFGYKIIEPMKITADDFYPHLYEDKPYVMVEIEPEYYGAITMAYNTPAPIATFGARRALCPIDRIMSVRLRKEVLELATWSVSLRDILADLQLKEVIQHIDTRFMTGINACVGVTPGTVMAATGSIHYHEYHDGLTHQTIAESLKIIPRLGRGRGLLNGLNAKTLLMNNVTFQEFAKWPAWEMGADFTSGIFKDGVQTVETAFGIRIVETIKSPLVQDGEVYYFADPDFIGKHFVFTEPTMIVKNHDHSVEFHVFTECGGAVFVYLGVAKALFNGVQMMGMAA
jgi:hypothetical protein